MPPKGPSSPIGGLCLGFLGRFPRSTSSERVILAGRFRSAMAVAVRRWGSHVGVDAFELLLSPL